LDPEKFIGSVLSSPFVNDKLYVSALGGDRKSVDAALLYLKLPVQTRPQISYLFDAKFYLATQPDVEAAGTDPFAHFIQHGCSEARSPHPLIDIKHIIKTDPFLLPASFGTFELYETLRYDLVNPSPYFSLDYYRTQLPRSARETWGLLEHFCTTGFTGGMRPNPFLDPHWYYRQLEGIHDIWSGLRHFILVGDSEGRASSAEFSGKRYLERNPDVAAAGIPPLLHYLTIGMAEGRPSVPERDGTTSFSSVLDVNEGAGSGEIKDADSIALYQAFKARVAGRRQDEKNVVSVSPPDIVHFDNPIEEIANLTLPRFDAPRVSILIPVYNEANYTVECLASILRSQTEVSYEVVLADDASPDPSTQALADVQNIKLVRQTTNLGFLRNCNASFKTCQGEYLLLLNNDAQLMRVRLM
jgi:O-antigen biosynthesis protein